MNKLTFLFPLKNPDRKIFFSEKYSLKALIKRIGQDEQEKGYEKYGEDPARIEETEIKLASAYENLLNAVNFHSVPNKRKFMGLVSSTKDKYLKLAFKKIVAKDHEIDTNNKTLEHDLYLLDDWIETEIESIYENLSTMDSQENLKKAKEKNRAIDKARRIEQELSEAIMKKRYPEICGIALKLIKEIMTIDGDTNLGELKKMMEFAIEIYSGGIKVVEKKYVTGEIPKINQQLKKKDSNLIINNIDNRIPIKDNKNIKNSGIYGGLAGNYFRDMKICINFFPGKHGGAYSLADKNNKRIKTFKTSEDLQEGLIAMINKQEKKELSSDLLAAFKLDGKNSTVEWGKNAFFDFDSGKLTPAQKALLNQNGFRVLLAKKLMKGKKISIKNTYLKEGNSTTLDYVKIAFMTKEERLTEINEEFKKYKKKFRFSPLYATLHSINGKTNTWAWGKAFSKLLKSSYFEFEIDKNNNNPDYPFRLVGEKLIFAQEFIVHTPLMIEGAKTIKFEFEAGNLYDGLTITENTTIKGLQNLSQVPISAAAWTTTLGAAAPVAAVVGAGMWAVGKIAGSLPERKAEAPLPTEVLQEENKQNANSDNNKANSKTGDIHGEVVDATNTSLEKVSIDDLRLCGVMMSLKGNRAIVANKTTGLKYSIESEDKVAGGKVVDIFLDRIVIAKNDKSRVEIKPSEPEIGIPPKEKDPKLKEFLSKKECSTQLEKIPTDNLKLSVMAITSKGYMVMLTDEDETGYFAQEGTKTLSVESTEEGKNYYNSKVSRIYLDKVNFATNIDSKGIQRNTSLTWKKLEQETVIPASNDSSKKVSIRCENAAVEVFFRIVREITGGNFVVENDIEKRITLNIKNPAPINQIVQKVLADLDLKLIDMGGNHLIVSKNKEIDSGFVWNDPSLEKKYSKRYNREKIALDFQGTDLKNIIRKLRKLSKGNIILDKDIKVSINLTLKKPVAWDMILDIVLRMNQLKAMNHNGNIFITTPEKYEKFHKQKSKECRVFKNKETYTGDPIVLDAKEITIDGFFTLIKEVIKDKNFTIDPNIANKTFSLTIKKDLPWDQVVELVLMKNNLRIIQKNNIYYIEDDISNKNAKKTKKKDSEIIQDKESKLQPNAVLELNKEKNFTVALQGKTYKIINRLGAEPPINSFEIIGNKKLRIKVNDGNFFDSYVVFNDKGIMEEDSYGYFTGKNKRYKVRMVSSTNTIYLEKAFEYSEKTPEDVLNHLVPDTLVFASDQDPSSYNFEYLNEADAVGSYSYQNIDNSSKDYWVVTFQNEQGESFQKEIKIINSQVTWSEVMRWVNNPNPDKNKIKQLIDIRSAGGHTALLYAVHHNKIKAVKLLIKNGADLNLQTKYGTTALMFAVKNNYADIIKLLIDQENIDVNMQDHEGQTALMHADKNKNIKSATELLKNNNLNLNTQDKYGKTALMYAVLSENLSFVKSLIKAKADLNIQANDGYTALIAASLYGNKDIVAELLEAEGIDINITDKDGKTALMIAAGGIRKNYLDIIKLIAKKLDQATKKQELYKTLLDTISNRFIISDTYTRDIANAIKNNQAETYLQKLVGEGKSISIENIPVKIFLDNKENNKNLFINTYESVWDIILEELGQSTFMIYPESKIPQNPDLKRKYDFIGIETNDPNKALKDFLLGDKIKFSQAINDESESIRLKGKPEQKMVYFLGKNANKVTLASELKPENIKVYKKRDNGTFGLMKLEKLADGTGYEVTPDQGGSSLNLPILEN